MSHALDRLLQGAAAALKAVGAVLLWIEVAIVFLQVASRYLLNDSIAWTEEASRLTLVWLAFIGAATASFLGAHLRLDLLDGMLRRRSSLLATRTLVVAASLVVLVALVHGNSELIDIRGGIPFTTFPLSSKWLAYAVTVGGVLMILGAIGRLLGDWLAPGPSLHPDPER